MQGYKQDEYGNFHPVNVPDPSDHRAQGVDDVIANISQQVNQGIQGQGLPGTLAHATRGWVAPGQVEVPGAPIYPAGTHIHSDDDPTRKSQLGGWKKGNWYRVHIDGTGPNDPYSWFWIPTNYFVDSRSGGGVSTTSANPQTQAVLQAIGNGASVQSFQDGFDSCHGNDAGSPRQRHVVD